MNNHQINPCFLFGSGASIAAGYPPVKEITDDILSGNTKWHFTEPPGGSVGETVAFLCWLKTVVDDRYASEIGRTANYEDIYFLASQVRDDLLGEFDNPAIKPLREKAIVEFLLAQDKGLPKIDKLQTLAKDATDIIHGHVAASLGKQPKIVNHLDFLAEAFQEIGEGNTVLMTLNHDMLIETFLNSRKIGFVDGFVVNSLGIRQWQPSSFDEAKNSLRLLKLHGGFNWLRLQPDKAENEDYVGIPPSDFSSAKKDEQGRRHGTCDGRPIFLIGTFNKLINYIDRVYFELYRQGNLALQKADELVVVGYGFGDKGINKMVIEWMVRSRNHRLVVVDKCPDTLRNNARPAIFMKWEEWLKEQRLFPLKCDLGKDKLHWQEITEKIRNSR